MLFVAFTLQRHAATGSQNLFHFCSSQEVLDASYQMKARRGPLCSLFEREKNQFRELEGMLLSLDGTSP